MRATLILVNKYFWRGYIGPIFAYVIPFILTMFIGRIVGPVFIIPGAFVIPTLCILLVFMPQTIFEFKSSSILKRIGSTPIKPYKFLFAIGLFNLTIVVTAFLFLLSICCIIFYDSMSGGVKPFIEGAPFMTPDFMFMMKNADWWSFIYASMLTMIMSIFIGLFIAAVGKSTLFIQSFGISLLLIVLFVGPAILPISMAGSVNVVRYLGYIVPLKYSISLSIEAFTSGLVNSIVNINDSSIWNISDPYEVLSFFNSTGSASEAPKVIEIFSSSDKIANLIMPWLFIFLFAYLTSATFGWSNRGKTVYHWNIAYDSYKLLKQKKLIKLNAAQHAQANLDADKAKNIIEIHNISKTFFSRKGDVSANDNISFNIERGRNLAILGANGAGKTVLIEMIIGINHPDQGHFKYNYAYDKTFQEKIGVQFQDSNYPFGIRGKDIISFFLNAYKIKMPEAELEQLVKDFGIEKFYKKNISSLSGGQQQRMNLLLAILHKPKIVFLDELSTGLDIKIRNSIKTFIKKYAKDNNITIVIISHDMSEVKYLCKDIVTLKDGKVVDITTIDHIEKKHKSLEHYIDDYL